MERLRRKTEPETEKEERVTFCFVLFIHYSGTNRRWNGGGGKQIDVCCGGGWGYVCSLCLCVSAFLCISVCFEYVHVYMRISLARSHALLKCPCDISYARIMAYTCIHVCL